MGSFHHPKHSFDSNELTDLDLAFDFAWGKLAGSVREPLKAEALKDTLRRKILLVAKSGVTGSQAIGAVALDYMPPLSSIYGGMYGAAKRKRAAR